MKNMMPTNVFSSEAGTQFYGPVPPTKPQRPLSAYNLFFRLERDRLLSSHNHESTASDRHETSSVAGGTRICAEDVAKISDETRYGVVRRQDRKKHGKIGFAELAKLIAKKWKEISESEKKLLQERAQEEKRKYNEKLKAYMKNLKEYRKQQPSQQESANSLGATTSPKEKEGAEIAAEKNYHQGIHYSDRNKTSHFKEKKNQIRHQGKLSMANRRQEQLLTMWQQHQKLRMIQQQQQWEVELRQRQEQAFMLHQKKKQQQLWEDEQQLLQEQALMSHQTMYPRNYRFVASKIDAVDLFDRSTDEAILIDSNFSASVQQLGTFSDGHASTPKPMMDYFPTQEPYYQSQTELAFNEEEDEYHGWIPPHFSSLEPLELSSNFDHNEGSKEDYCMRQN